MTEEETCREFLGLESGWCDRPAHVVTGNGFRCCWPHAEERARHVEQIGKED